MSTLLIQVIQCSTDNDDIIDKPTSCYVFTLTVPIVKLINRYPKNLDNESGKDIFTTRTRDYKRALREDTSTVAAGVLAQWKSWEYQTFNCWGEGVR